MQSQSPAIPRQLSLAPFGHRGPQALQPRPLHWALPFPCPLPARPSPVSPPSEHFPSWPALLSPDPPSPPVPTVANHCGGHQMHPQVRAARGGGGDHAGQHAALDSPQRPDHRPVSQHSPLPPRPHHPRGPQPPSGAMLVGAACDPGSWEAAAAGAGGQGMGRPSLGHARGRGQRLGSDGPGPPPRGCPRLGPWTWNDRPAHAPSISPSLVFPQHSSPHLRPFKSKCPGGSP